MSASPTRALSGEPITAPVDSATESVLQQATLWVERLAPVYALALLLVFGSWAWLASRGVRLQFDELLEISAASAPTSHQILSFLASGVDFNPPLSHYLIRASMSLFGPTEWAARLPAVLGMGVLLVCLYSFLSRRLGRSYGVVAMLVVLCTPVRNYAIQARPYGVVLGLSGVALLLYDAAVQGRRRWFALAGLAVCLAALVASHYYAVLVVGVLVAAELARVWQSRRLDWPLLAACLCAPITVLWLLHDAIRQQRTVLTHYFARGNLLSFKHGYDDLLMDPLVYCVALLLIVGVISLRSLNDDKPFLARLSAKPPIQELVLSLGLLTLPIAGAFLTQFVTHAYVPRYFLPAVIGFAICICYAVRRFSRVVPSLLLILMFSLTLGFAKAILQEAPHRADVLPALSDLTAEETPLVFDTPGTYLQTAYYFPALRNNMWVIADPSASLRYRQYDTDDKIMQALAGVGRAQTISLSEAVRRWPHFRLVPRSADYVWALKCLMDSGSQLEVKHAFGNSNFIFDVAVPADKARQIDACAAL